MRLDSRGPINNTTKYVDHHNNILVALIRFNDSRVADDDQQRKGHYSTYHRIMDGKIVGRQSSKERNRTARESRGDRLRRITSKQFNIIHFYFSSHAIYNPILVEEDAIIIFILGVSHSIRHLFSFMRK